MVVDWSAASPFLVQLERSFDDILARYGRNVPISIGDIWLALQGRCPEGSTVEIDCPEFRRFLKRRLLDQLRRHRRQTRRFGIPSDFNGTEPTSGLRDPLDELIRAEKFASVRTSLDEIAGADRELILARFDKRSSKPAEMARDLGLSLRTIKRRGDKAWVQLLRMLDQGEQTGDDL